jgi:transcriptional regulator with XRE-family HTH domain
MKFGERLRELRKQQGISQRDLATMTEVDFTYISKIETGDTPPPSSITIHRIAQVLNVDESELFYLAGKVPDGLRVMMRDNPLLVELVRVLSQRKLPDDIYKQMIKLTCEIGGNKR